MREELLQPFEHGRSVIRGELDDEERARLLEIREQRPQPLRDDKAITSWNGLALAALAEAGRADSSAPTIWTRPARSASSCSARSRTTGRLHRTYRAGEAKGAGLPRGLRGRRERPARAPRRDRRPALAPRGAPAGAACGRAVRGRRARRLLPLVGDGEELVTRKKDLDDHPTPSGNSMLAYVLLRLARIWGDDELEQPRRRRVPPRPRRRRARAVRVRPRADRARPPLLPAARAGDRRPVDSEVARAALEPFQPDTVVAFGPADDVPLLAGKGLVDGKPAVYVCERFACQAPITSYDAFTAP